MINDLTTEVSVTAHIRRMQDDLADLVAALNKQRSIDDATKVQSVIAALYQIDELTDFDNIAWPLRVGDDGELAWGDFDNDD